MEFQLTKLIQPTQKAARLISGELKTDEEIDRKLIDGSGF